MSYTEICTSNKCRLLDSSHSDWHEMVPHCGFDLHFSISEGFKDPKLSHGSGRGESKGPPQLVLLLSCSGKGGHPSGFGDSLGTQGTGEALL